MIHLGSDEVSALLHSHIPSVIDYFHLHAEYKERFIKFEFDKFIKFVQPNLKFVKKLSSVKCVMIEFKVIDRIIYIVFYSV